MGDRRKRGSNFAKIWLRIRRVDGKGRVKRVRGEDVVIIGIPTPQVGDKEAVTDVLLQRSPTSRMKDLATSHMVVMMSSPKGTGFGESSIRSDV